MKINARKLIEIQIYVLLVVESLISILHFPGVFRYFLDVNMILLILLTSFAFKRNIKDRKTRLLMYYIIGYMFITSVFAYIMDIPFGQIVWGMRNNFFVLIFFMICVLALHVSDLEKMWKFVVKMQLFNVICGVYEYFFMGVKNDYLGGMFGTDAGCNGYLNIYLVVITVYTFSQYMHKKTALSNSIWILSSSLFLTAISELKIYFAELILIFALVIFLDKQSMKSFAILVFGVAGLFVGLKLLEFVNSDSMQYIASIDDIVEYSSRSEYGRVIKIARFTFFDQIDTYFFNGSLSLLLFGFGLGYGEASTTFGWANSEFANTYDDLGYRNITSAVNLLEGGVVGLAAFIAIFVFIFFIANGYKNKKGADKSAAIFSQVMAILLIANCFYNAAIRREIAYLSFMALATVFVYMKETGD